MGFATRDVYTAARYLRMIMSIPHLYCCPYCPRRGSQGVLSADVGAMRALPPGGAKRAYSARVILPGDRRAVAHIGAELGPRVVRPP